MGLSRSLSRFVCWDKVIAALGIPVTSRALPLQIHCPLCKGSRLLIVPDPAADGQWHYCRDCGSKGDIIDLASKAWKLSHDATVAKLVQMGALYSKGEPATKLIRRYTKAAKRLERIEAMLERGKEYVLHSKELSVIMNKLEVVSRATPERYRRTYGRIMGGMPAIDVEAVFTPRNVVYNKPGAKRKSAKSATRIFKTGWWGDVLFIPFYDLPGRVSRFQFIGREGRLELDWPAKYTADSTHKFRDPGLTFHPDLVKQMPSTVFAVEDLVIYLRLQAFHHSKSDKVLPLVNWYDSLTKRTDRAWNMFSTSKVIFWCWDMTAAVVEQAIRVNGDICCTNLDDKSEAGVRHFINRSTPEAMLKMFEKQAKPWPEALDQWAARVSEEQVEDLLRQLQVRGCNLELHLARCSKTFQAKAERVLATTTSRTVTTSNCRVIEDCHGWSKLKNDGSLTALISDAVLKLDKAVYNPVDKQTYYQGRVLFNEHEVPFCESRKTLEKDTFGWMHDLLLKEQLGVMRYDHTWSNKAMNLALMFSNVRQVAGLTSIGWNSDDNRIELPQFAIDFRGTVLNQDKALIMNSAPALRLEPPAVLTPIDLAPLTEDSDSSRIFWAGWLACAANILAPVVGVRTVGLAVVTESCESLVQAACASCGCNYVPLTRKSFDLARDEEYRHNWPVMIGLADQAQKVLLRELLDSSTEARNCIVRANWWQGRTLLLQGWNMLEAEADGIPAKLAMEAHKLLPAYLKNFFERQLTIDSSATGLVQRVADDVCVWLESVHADTTVVREAAGLLRYGSEVNDDLVGEMLCNLLVEGKAQIVPQEFADTNSIIRTKQGLFIPRSLLENVVDKKTAIDLDWEKVSSQLAEAKKLVGEVEIQGHPGIIVEEGWLAKIRKRMQNDKTPRLRIVGE